MKAQMLAHTPLAKCSLILCLSSMPLGQPLPQAPVPRWQPGMVPTPTDTAPAPDGPSISAHLGPGTSSRPTAVFR